MKKLLLALILCLIIPTMAMAYPFHDGDQVIVTDSDWGNFLISNYNDVSINEETYCVQMNTYFDFDTEYLLAQVGPEITGFAPGDIGSHWIEDGTRYLFGSFSAGELAGFNGTESDINNLQKAIWAFQGYNVDVASNPFYQAALLPDLQYYEVMALNLYDYNKNPIQSQLTYNPEPNSPPSVPEPTSAALILMGIVGLVAYKRKA